LLRRLAVVNERNGDYVQVDYSALRRFSSSIEKTAWNQLLRRGAAMWAAITNIENAS
jgi:hypothetical protein